MDKEILGAISVAAGLIGSFWYWRSIHAGQSRPHLFSFLVWSILAAIAAVAQISSGAGPGAWISICTAIIGIITTIWACSAGEKNITRGDWISLTFALSAIPLWMATKNPLWAIAIVSLIDCAGFYPTMRKSWDRPDQENMAAWSLNVVKLGIALPAMNELTLVTALYPASFLVLNALFVCMCLLRRSAIANQAMIEMESVQGV
ncbi:hypothetical protein BH11PSE11_BH11PSE11_29150 [soil metagenome]